MDPETSADKTKSVKARMSAYALRLPASIKAEAEKIARDDGTSFNQFVASAVAEKVAADPNPELFRAVQGARESGRIRPHHATENRRAAAARRRDAGGLRISSRASQLGASADNHAVVDA
jgi:hypothetical protein